MENDVHYLNYVLDSLADVEEITFKKKFGAICFYRNGLLIGVISGGKFRLRMPTCTRDICGDIHSAPFFHTITQNDSLFCEVPEEVIENKALLSIWIDNASLVASAELSPSGMA